MSGQVGRTRVAVQLWEHTRHSLDDKVNELVLQHRLTVEVGDEEGDVVALRRKTRHSVGRSPRNRIQPPPGAPASLSPPHSP